MLGKYKINLITNYQIILSICGDPFMSKTPGFQILLVKAKCKNYTLEELFELHRTWFTEFERSLVFREWNWISLYQSAGMNLQRDSLHQGSPYLCSQEALSEPSKALKSRNQEVQAACHRKITSLAICHLNIDISWSVLALKEPSLFLQVTELLQLWCRD